MMFTRVTDTRRRLSIFVKVHLLVYHLLVYHLSTKGLFYCTALRNLSLSTKCIAFYVKLKNVT
jgi:hypothetical protein